MRVKRGVSVLPDGALDAVTAGVDHIAEALRQHEAAVAAAIGIDAALDRGRRRDQDHREDPGDPVLGPYG